MNEDEGFDADAKRPPVPAMTDHAPVPIVGVFASSVTLFPQLEMSAPALAVVGGGVTMMVTSALDSGHDPLAMVQRSS